MAQCLSSTLDVVFGAMEMPPSYMFLAERPVRLADVILLFVGPGVEGGEAPLLCDITKAAWRSGNLGAPPPTFQTSRGFRKHGHLYRGSSWLSIADSKHTTGMGEAVSKLVESGSPCVYGCIKGPRRPTLIGPDAGTLGR